MQKQQMMNRLRRMVVITLVSYLCAIPVFAEAASQDSLNQKLESQQCRVQELDSLQSSVLVKDSLAKDSSQVTAQPKIDLKKYTGTVEAGKVGRISGNGVRSPSRTRKNIENGIVNVIPKVEELYNKSLKTNSDVQCKFIVKFLIISNGDVIKAEVEEGELKDEAFEKELLAIISSVSYRKISKGTVTVRYPFTFTRK